jgi:type IV secretion system protein VirB10
MPMIIDNTGTGSAGRADPKKDAPTPSTAQPAGLSSDEMFALRTGTDLPPATQAVAMSDPSQIIAQGTLIPAVLETALNSDLPGFARAIVSRDVHSFDGSRTLVPRGSRLIGQYKSGLATGQSRAFIVWTRLLRPDGVSVQLGSPVLDETGEVGLSGDVNRHFWQRFGSSILLSVVAGATGAISSGSSTVVIGTSGAQSAASTALEADSKIPPTIRVPLGTPIQVFVARDLDFSR